MGLGELFKNKLFLQYLGAAGQDIAEGGVPGANVNAVTKESITSQNYVNMLKQFLAGEVPGGKLSADEKGVKLNIPKDAFNFGGQQKGTAQWGGEISTSKTGEAISKNPTLAGVGNPTEGGAVSKPNPFLQVLSGLSDSDLAGMSPELINSALGIALGRGEADLDKRYKEALIAQAEATTLKTLRPEKGDKPASIKEYEYAKTQGFDGTLEDWKKTDPTSWQEYELAKMDEVDPFEGSYFEFMKEKAEAGSTRISVGEKAETAAAVEEAVTEVRDRTYYTKPTGLAKDVKDFHGSKQFRRAKMNYSDDVSDEDISAIETVKFIENNITSGGIKILGVDWEDPDTQKIMVWDVIFKDGKEGKIKYAIR